MVVQTQDLRQRPMVAQAVKDLLRRIHVDGLEPGDKLPPQSALRICEGRGAGTLDAAMAVLVERGVLSRKRRVGTVIEDPQAAVPGLWTVGYAYAPEDLGSVPFPTLLSALVQGQLVQRGFNLKVFPRQRTELNVDDRLGNFDRLPTAVAEQDIDALATTASLARDALDGCATSGVPLVHLGHAYRMPCASLFDRREWRGQALASLRDQGAKRIQLAYNYIQQEVDLGPWWSAFCAALGGEPVIHALGNGHEAGMAIADRLLALPAKQRPDGLIITDDRIASGLTLRLAVAGSYRPLVAVQTCLQVPQPYGWPVTSFACDLAALVADGIDLLDARIRNPTLAPEQRIQPLARMAERNLIITGRGVP